MMMMILSTECPRCHGTGEIITDWERYLHALPGDKGDEGVADCPNCDGTGAVDYDPEDEVEEWMR